MRVRLLRYIICSMIFSLFIVHASSDLWIEKNIDTGAAKYGDTVSYTILFGNSGAGSVTDAVIIDRLPTGLNIMSSAWQVGAGGWISNYNAATGNVVSYEYIYNSGDVVSTSYRRDIGSIGIGETGSLVITAAIDQSFAPQPSGVSGMVYNFDGINHYADYGTAATIDRGTSDFTVSIWIYKLSGTTALNNGDNSFVAGQWYGGGDTPGQNERALFMGNGVDQDNASFRVEVNGEIKSAADGGGGGSLSLNQRYHLVGMRDGTDIKLYINGTLAATTDIGTGTLNDRDQTELFVALQAGGPTTHISQLRAYDFRIFSGAKTTDDIATIMSGGVIRTGLLQRYKMDEGTGTVSYDSVNGGTGFLDHVAVSDPFYYPTDRPSFHGALGYYRPGGSGGVFFPRWEVTDNYCLDVFGRWLDFAAGICNYTEIYSSDPDINTTNNSGARYLVYTPTADVYITQSVTGDYVSGNFVTFTITYGNSGVDAVTGLEVTSTLSDGLSGTSSNPSWNSINGGTYTRDIGDMAFGSTGMIVFTAQIVTGADNAYLYHRASVDSELTDLYTSNNANNRSVYANPPDQSDLYIAKTATPSSVKRDEYVTYTITYGNSGNVAQSGVYITDTLPVGVTYVSSQVDTGNGFTGFTVITGVNSSGQQTIMWSGLSVSVDGTGTIVFTAQVVQTFLSADPTTYSGFVAHWKADNISGLSDHDPVHAWPSAGDQYYYFDGVDDRIVFGSPTQAFVNNGDYIEFGLRGLVAPTGSAPLLGTLSSPNDYIYISDAVVHTRVVLTSGIRRQTDLTFPTGKTVADLVRVRYTRVSNTSVQINYEYNDGEEYTTFMSPVGSPDFTVDTFFFEHLMAGLSTYIPGGLTYFDLNGTTYNYDNVFNGETIDGSPKLGNTLYATGTEKPTYKTNIQNGLPAIEFSGGIVNTLYAPATFGLGEQHTIVYVVEPFATDTSQYIGVSGTGQGDYSFWATDDAVASFYMKPTNSDNFYQRQPDYTWGDMMFVTFLRSGSVVDLFNHYTQVPSSVSGALNSGTSWLGLGTVASSGAEDLSFEGYVYEVLLYQDNLSDADIFALQDMLYGKYYLSGSTPTSIGNTVVIGCDCTELDTGNNTALAQTDYTLQSDVYIDKTTTDTNVRKGDYITYTITVGNSGEAMATDVVITDMLLTGLAYSTSSMVRPNNNGVSVPTQTLLASGTQLVRSGLYLRPGLTGTIILTAQILTNFVTTDIVSSFPGLTGHWDAAAITGLASGDFIDTRPDSSTNSNDLSAPTVEITRSKPISKHSLQGAGRTAGGQFTDNGNKFYYQRTTVIYQYNLSTPYDPSTWTFTDSFDLSTFGFSTNFKDFERGDNGNKLYLVGSNDDKIYELDASTPYDMSTLSDSGNTFSFGSTEPSADSLQIRSSTEFYLLGVPNTIHKIVLSTPRDISTASITVTKDFSASISASQVNGFSIYNSGQNMLVIGNDELTVYDLEMTAWDISTLTSTGQEFEMQDSGTRGYYIQYIDSNDKIFGIEDSDFHEYSFNLRPQRIENAINGNPGVYFDPDLYAYMTLESELILGTENTIILVTQPSQPPDTMYYAMNSDGGSYLINSNSSEDPIPFNFNYGGAFNFDKSYGDTIVFTVTRDGTTNSVYDLYENIAPNSQYTYGGLTQFYGISAISTYLRKLQGYIYELLIYDGALLQTHLTQLTDYLNYKRLLGVDVMTGVSNTVTATTTTSEFSTTNNTSNSIISYTGTADIELTSKSVNRGVVYRDQQLVYTLTATNIGDAIATGVQIIDVLASGLVYNTSTVYTTASGYISVVPNQESIVTGTRLTRSGFVLGVGETATVIFTATMQDSIVGGTGSYLGYALTFDEQDDYVTVGDHAALDFDIDDAFSVSLRMKHSEIGSHRFLVSKEDANPIGWNFYIDEFTDSLDVSLRTNGSNQIRVRGDDNWQVDDNEWHHVAFTYNGNKDATGVVLYIDGEVVTDIVVVSNDDIDANDSMAYDGPLAFGIRELSTQYDFGGEMYDVRIFNTVKTQQEIKNIMRGYADPNNLVGRRRFDEGTGDILYDSSGNGFHGTRSGDVSFVTHTGNSFRDAIGGQLSGSTYIPLDMSNPQYDVLGNTITNTYNITNIAQVVLGSYEYITTNNTNAAFVQPVVANDVHISLSATGTYQFGENVVLTLLYSGSGPDTVTGTITLALVDALSGTTVSMPGYSFSDNIYTRSMSIGSGTMGSIVLTAQVASSTGNVGGINTGIITHDYYLADDSDDIDISSTVLNYGTDIAISQRMHSGDMRSGDLVNLIIEYENLGPYTGTNLTIISSISPSISLLSSIPTRDDYPTIDLTTAGGHGDYAVLDTSIQINEVGVVNRLQALIHDYADSSNGTLFGHTGTDNYFQGLSNDSVSIRFGTDVFSQTVSGLDLSAIGDFYLEIEFYNDGVNPLNIQRWIRSASDYDTILATNSGTLTNFGVTNLINLFTSYQGVPRRLLDAKVDYVKLYEDDVLEHYRIWLGEGDRIFDVVGGNHATIVSDDLAALADTQDTYSHQVLYGRSVQQTGGSNVDVPNNITGGTLSLPGYTVTQTYPANTYIWTIGSVGSGDNDIIVAEGQMTTGTVNVPVYAHTTGSISEYDENTGNDSASTISTGNSWYDLSITKSADVGTASLYDYITYTITYINSGVATGTDVTLTDKLASGLWYQSSRIDTGAGYVSGSPVITGNASGETIVTRGLGDVGPNASGTIVLTAYVVNAFVNDLDLNLGRGYYFDGDDDYVEGGPIDITTWTSFYFDTRFKANSGDYGVIFSMLYSGGQDIRMNMGSNGDVVFVFDDGGTSINITADSFDYNDGNWYHAVATYDGGTEQMLKIYDSNDDLIETATQDRAFNFTGSMDGTFTIGTRSTNYVADYTGYIAGLRLGQSADNLVVFYKMDEGEGLIAYDSAGSDDAGRLYGDVTHIIHTGLAGYQDIYGYNENYILGSASADQMHIGYNGLWILDVPVFDGTINDAGYIYQTNSGTPIDATTSIDLERTSSTPAVIARNLSTNHRNWLDTYADTRLVRYTVDMAGYGDVDRTQLEVSAVSGTSQVVYGGGRTTVSVLVQRDKNAAAGRGVNIRAYKSAGGIGRGLKIYSIKVEILSGYIPRDEYNPGYDVYGKVLDYRPSIFNYFTATGAGYDTVANDKKSTRTQYVNQPDLRISKTANVDSIYRNQYITYTITFDNIGDTTGTDLVVTDTLLSGVQYVSSSLTGDVSSYNFGTATNASGHTILSRTGMTLGVGQTGTIVLTAQVISSLAAAGYGPIQPGRAYQFNGLGSYIRIPHSSGYDITDGEFTFATWVKLSAQQVQYLGQKRVGGSAGWHIYLLSDGTIQVGGQNDTQSILGDSNDTLSLDVWYHIAVVYSNHFIKIYINGELDATYYHQISLISATGQDLRLFEDGGSVRSLSGQAYDVRLYNRALNAGNIRAIYNYDTSITPSLWLRLDEGSSTVAYDSAGNGYTGELSAIVHVTTDQHSYHNEFGYTYSGGRYVPANISNIGYDVLGSPLQYTVVGIPNIVSISSGNDYDEINNTYTQRTAYVGSPDLTITKQVSDLATAYYNKQVGYTITVTNHGDGTATGVTVTDVLPSGMQYVSYTTNQIANENFGTGMSGSSQQLLTWSGFNLSIGATGIIVMTAAVKEMTTPLLSGRAYDFDGMDDYVSVPTASEFDFGKDDPFSIAVWIKVNNISNYERIVAKESASTTGWIFSFDNTGKPRLILRNTSVSNELLSQMDSTIDDNTWKHLVVTYDGSSNANNVKFYVNGLLENSSTIRNSLTSDFKQSFEDMYFMYDKSLNYTLGSLASVQIFDYELDNTQVSKIYLDMTDTDISPVGLRIMDEGTGVVAYDIYSNNHGSLENGVIHINYPGSFSADVYGYGYSIDDDLRVPGDSLNLGYDHLGKLLIRSPFYYNYAHIALSGYEFNTNNNDTLIVSASGYTDAVDLSISMTATGVYVSGGLIRYTITYTNNGMATTGVSVTSTLSNTLSGVSATTGRDNYTGGIYTWENIDLTAGETGSIVFTAQAVSGWTYAPLVNTATIIAGNFIDLATGNNTAIASNRLYQGQPIAVIVDQSADVNTAVYNDIVTYTISFYASGATGDLSDVSLYTYMTTGLTYISHVLTGVTGYNFSMGNTAGGSQYLHRTGDWLYGGVTGTITLTTRVTQFNEPAIYHESSAYQFDGQNDYIAATITGTDYLSGPNKTYVVDLYHTTQPGQGFISLLQDNPTLGNNLSAKINGLQYDGNNGDKVWLSVGDGTSFGGTNADYIFPAAGWYRVVGVVKGNDYARLYVNGVEVGANDSLSISPVSYGNIYIGKAGSQEYSGMMYNIQVWNAARDSGDVLYHYNTNDLPTNRSGTDLSTDDMVLWYQGNEGTGTVAYDAAGNGNDGSLNFGVSYVTINTGWNAYNLFGYNTSGSLYYPLDASRPYFDIFGEPLRYLYGYIPVVSTVTASTATGALPMTESGISVAFNDIYDVYTVTVQPAFRQNSTYEMTGDFRVIQYTGGARSGVYNSVKTTGDTQISIGYSGTGTVALPNNVFASGDMYMVVFKGLGALSVGYTGTRTDDLTGFDFTDASNPHIYPSFVYNGTNLLKMGDVDVSTIGTYDLVVGGDYQVINSALSRGSSIATGNAHYDLDNNGFVTSIEQATVIQFLDDDGYIGRLDLNDIILKTGFVSF